MSNLNPLRVTVSPAWAGKTVDSFLQHKLGFSHRGVRALKKPGGILLDGHDVTVRERLKGGETLVLGIAPLFQNITPDAIDLEIIFEDQDLVVVNKPAGMVVHPVKKHQNGTLANALVYYWREQGETASFHPVHRLDRLTSGLVLIAKHPWAHQQLALQLESGAMKRLYLAVCQGIPSLQSGKIIAPIKEFTTTAKREVLAEGRPSITRFRVLSKSVQSALLAVKLLTGRTHQIRVHLAHLGNPLWGDPLYGTADPMFTRQALHAVRLCFTHPRTGLKIKLTTKIAPDIMALLSEQGIKK